MNVIFVSFEGYAINNNKRKGNESTIPAFKMFNLITTLNPTEYESNRTLVNIEYWSLDLAKESPDTWGLQSLTSAVQSLTWDTQTTLMINILRTLFIYLSVYFRNLCSYFNLIFFTLLLGVGVFSGRLSDLTLQMFVWISTYASGILAVCTLHRLRGLLYLPSTCYMWVFLRECKISPAPVFLFSFECQCLFNETTSFN